MPIKAPSGSLGAQTESWLLLKDRRKGFDDMAEVTSFWGHKGLQRRFGKVDGEPPKGLDDGGRWRRLMGMKQILVMLVGCGSKEAPELQEFTDIMAHLLTSK